MDYFYKKASSLLPGSLHHEAEQAEHGDIRQSSSAAEQQPIASTQRATADQSSNFVAPEPTRAKQSGLLSKDNNQFGSVTGKQPVKEPSKPMPASATTEEQQQQPESGVASNANEIDPNQGMITDDVQGHEDQFYGSAIEQRKAPMSNVTQQHQSPTTGTHSRKDSHVLSDIPTSSHKQAVDKSETAAISPPSSQQQQPCQKVQFTSDAPQQKPSSSQPPPINTNTQPTAAPATTTTTTKTDDLADQGSFHPADCDHPAGKESTLAAGNVAPTQQQQSPPGEKRHGSRGSGHGIKSFLERITHPGHSGSKGERKSSTNTQQKDFNKYDISSAQKQGGLAAGPNPANGGLAAAGVGGAAMVTGIEAMEQEKQRQQQQQPSTQPTTKGMDDRDLGKSGAGDDTQQQQNMPPEKTNNGNGMKQQQQQQQQHATTGAGDSNHATTTTMNQQERSNLDHMDNIQSSTTANDMQRTNQSTEINNAMQQQQPTDTTNRHGSNQVTGNNSNNLDQNVASTQQQHPPVSTTDQPVGGVMNDHPTTQVPTNSSQQPMATTTAKGKNAATEASEQQMQQPISAGDDGTGGDTMTTTTAPNTGQVGAKEQQHHPSMTAEAAATQQSNEQQVPVSTQENGGKAKKWISTPPTGKGIGGVMGLAGATAVGAGVAHEHGDTSNNSHLQQQQEQHGPSSSGDTAAQNDVAQQEQPPQRRRSFQEYLSGMIDTRRGSFKESLGKLLHRQNWENDGQALRMHGQQKIDEFHAAQQAHKKSITAM